MVECPSLFVAQRFDGIQTRGAQGWPQAAEHADKNQNASGDGEHISGKQEVNVGLPRWIVNQLR